MFKGFLSYATIVMLLASYTANAVYMDCGDKSPADCKKEIMTKMSKEIMMRFIETLKTEMDKRIKIFSAMKDDLPPDSVHSKMLMNSLDEMRKQMPMVEKLGDMDIEEMERTVSSVVMSMDPNYKKARKEESDVAAKFKESMEKHGYMPIKMMEEATNMFMKDMEQMWMDMYSSLRPEDLKEYSQYREMDEMMKSIKGMPDGEEKLISIVKMMKMMNDFMETPFMRAMLTLICDDC